MDKTIKDVNSRFDDYSISPMVRQVLLHWGCELIKDGLLWFVLLVHIKMKCYQLNKDKLSEKAKDRYHHGGGKEKAAEYYLNNREVLKENARTKSRSLPEEEKKVKRTYGRDRYRNRTEDGRNRLK